MLMKSYAPLQPKKPKPAFENYKRVPRYAPPFVALKAVKDFQMGQKTLNIQAIYSDKQQRLFF